MIFSRNKSSYVTAILLYKPNTLAQSNVLVCQFAHPPRNLDNTGLYLGLDAGCIPLSSQNIPGYPITKLWSALHL